MKKTAQLILAGIAATSLFACKKNNDQTSTVSTNDAPAMQALFKTLAVQPKTVTIDVGVDNTFYGTSGTRYFFYRNSFMTASGAVVTGNVQVTVSEYLSKGDMIFSKMLPISNGEPLLSGGEINVIVKQSDQKLYLKPFATFNAAIPQNGPVPTGMKLFTGQPVVNNSDTAQRLVNWLPRDTVQSHNVGVGAWVADTLGIISDSLGLCNADHFMTSPNYQDFTVTAKGVTIPSTAAIFGYALYDNYKGVWQMGSVNKDGVFIEKHVPNIPVHFAVFGYIGGKFYGGTAAATPATGSNYNVTLTVADPAEFKAQLNAL